MFDTGIKNQLTLVEILLSDNFTFDKLLGRVLSKQLSIGSNLVNLFFFGRTGWKRFFSVEIVRSKIVLSLTRSKLLLRLNTVKILFHGRI